MLMLIIQNFAFYTPPCPHYNCNNVKLKTKSEALLCSPFPLPVSLENRTTPRIYWRRQLCVLISWGFIWDEGSFVQEPSVSWRGNPSIQFFWVKCSVCYIVPGVYSLNTCFVGCASDLGGKLRFGSAKSLFWRRWSDLMFQILFQGGTGALTQS